MGFKQVQAVGKEEKWAFTLVVGISDRGDLLGFQGIFHGKSTCSLPSMRSPKYQEAMDIGMKFEFSNMDTYWSTFELMCKWITDILVPYFMV